jgi:hypothetical protein
VGMHSRPVFSFDSHPRRPTLFTMSVLVGQPPAMNGFSNGTDDAEMSIAPAPAAAPSARFSSGMILPPPEIKGALA